ncbi:hypothetical protein QQS21_002564 [Conoideocrella luteorostrata]|uniref:Zn(2)-C6 fungal-type domain-containing protein n=1 Tax=Conoideocrella luteorostrata TaxID=1105319 RepID=A0AAJ0CUY1_9HYPO|nr:hypothetical protein QQS21_002564 [Conoideocrella luteorostrata]
MAPPVEDVKHKPQNRGKPRGMRRDRDCHSCKLRDVKCDLNRPSCTQCLEANITCGGYPHRVIWAAERTARDKDPPTAPASLSANTTNNRVQKRAPRGSRSRVIVEGSPEAPDPDQASTDGTTANAMAAKTESPVLELRGLPATDQNSFITSLVAFCQHIISSDDDSAGEHCRYLSAEAVRLISQLHDLMKARIEGRRGVPLLSGEVWDSIDTARHRLVALIGLNEALEAGNPFAFLGIAAFAVLEVCDSPFGEWQRHLHGAKSLLDYHCPNPAALESLSRTVTGLTEIVARLVWFDTLGAIARGTRGLIFDDWHRRTVDHRLFQVVGCSSDSFDLFSWVASGRVATDAVTSCVTAIEQLAKIDSDESPWGLSANVNRCASAISVLAQLDLAEATTMRALASAVDRACQLIAAMAPSSMYYIHVAVSAYLAGMHASSTHQCQILRTYWHRCNNAGVQRYPDGLAKCEDRWRSKGLTGMVD